MSTVSYLVVFGPYYLLTEGLRYEGPHSRESFPRCVGEARLVGRLAHLAVTNKTNKKY